MRLDSKDRESVARVMACLSLESVRRQGRGLADVWAGLVESIGEQLPLERSGCGLVTQEQADELAARVNGDRNA